MPRTSFPKVLLAILALVICTGTLQATATLTGPASIALTRHVHRARMHDSQHTTGVRSPALHQQGNGLDGPVGFGHPQYGWPSHVCRVLHQHGVVCQLDHQRHRVHHHDGCRLRGALHPNPRADVHPSDNGRRVAGANLTIPVTVTITTSNGSALVPSASAVTFTCNETQTSVSPTEHRRQRHLRGDRWHALHLGHHQPDGELAQRGVDRRRRRRAPQSAAVTLTPNATSCAALAAGTTTYNVPLVNAPAANNRITVTLAINADSPLTPSVNPGRDHVHPGHRPRSLPDGDHHC